MIAIVDYGAGNLASVVKGLRAAGASPAIARLPADLNGATGIVIPGVGHFAATASLDAPWRKALHGAVDGGTPLLGICLGMQFLFEGSDEAPGLAGLGLLEGRMFRMTGDVKVPHVGWNALEQCAAAPLLDGIDEGDAVYFTHSYAAPLGSATLARTNHGASFASIVARGRVSGMQFHPEKSGSVGIRLLRNWVGQCSASA